MARSKNPNKGKGRVEPYGARDIKSMFRNLANVAVQTAPTIAAAFSETHTGPGSRNKRSNVHYAPFGDSVSSFKTIQRKTAPKQYDDQNSYLRYRTLIGRLRPAINFQEGVSMIGIWENSDLISIMNADPTGPGAGVALANDQGALTKEYLFKRALCKVIFANVGAFTSHVTIYNIRAREVPFSSNDQSPLASWQEGMDQIAVGTTDEIIWGMEPTDTTRFKHHWEIQNRESFSLRPGEEHAHTWDIVANKSMRAEEFFPTAAGPVGGLSYFIMVRSFGQVATQDGDDTQVGLAPARVNWASYIKYYSRSAPGQVAAKINFATSALSGLTTPRIIGKESQVEQAEVTI